MPPLRGVGLSRASALRADSPRGLHPSNPLPGSVFPEARRENHVRDSRSLRRRSPRGFAPKPPLKGAAPENPAVGSEPYPLPDSPYLLYRYFAIFSRVKRIISKSRALISRFSYSPVKIPQISFFFLQNLLAYHCPDNHSHTIIIGFFRA